MKKHCLRRSVLYMPGSNQRALEKARSLPADCIIFDLEDAVSPAEKEKARAMAVAATHEMNCGEQELAIRINSLSTPWGRDDLAAVMQSRASAVVIPKLEHADEVREVASSIPEATSMMIWGMIETPRGVSRVEDIAAAHRRLNVLIMGTSDLAKELRIPHRNDRLGLLYALGHCVVAARAAGVDIIDGVQLDLKDEAALRLSCEQGRDLGFDGKSLIHPQQIECANQVFSPAPDKIDHAKKVIEAWDQAQKQGSGVVVVDGKLVENLHVEDARRILLMAELIAKK